MITSKLLVFRELKDLLLSNRGAYLVQISKYIVEIGREVYVLPSAAGHGARVQVQG